MSRVFDQWRALNEFRFPEGFIDERLNREHRKASSIRHQENEGLRRFFKQRHLIRTVSKYSGLQVWGGKHATNMQIRVNSLAIANLPSAFEGFRVLQISDPHFNGSNAISDALFDSLENLEYDLCVLTGDYRYRSFGPIEETIAGLRTIRNILTSDVVAILGNHDSLYMVPSMESMGMTVLLNETYSVTKGADELTVVGVDDPSYYKLADIEYALEHGSIKSPKHEGASVLLAHSPDLYQQGSTAGFSAYLCGHTHGGQFCLPGGIPIMVNIQAPRKFVAGPWHHNGMTGYTSVGAGVSIVEARLFCPPEITIHVMTSQPNNTL